MKVNIEIWYTINVGKGSFNDYVEIPYIVDSNLTTTELKMELDDFVHSCFYNVQNWSWEIVEK